MLATAGRMKVCTLCSLNGFFSNGCSDYFVVPMSLPTDNGGEKKPARIYSQTAERNNILIQLAYFNYSLSCSTSIVSGRFYLCTQLCCVV